MKGKFSLSPKVKKAMESFRLTRLYSCALVNDDASTRGMLQSCKDSVAFGAVGEDDILLLLSARGYSSDGKKLSSSKKPEEIKKLAAELASSAKTLADAGLVPLFFLAPPRGGFGSRKEQSPLGPLGKHEKIGELLPRMA